MNFGLRLREERKRIGLTQAEFAKKLGVSRNTQINYEAMDREPDVKYIARLEEIGVDSKFVVTGDASVLVNAGEALASQAEIVFKVVKDFEIVYRDCGAELDIDSRARVIAILYRLAYATGSVDHKTISEIIALSK